MVHGKGVFYVVGLGFTFIYFILASSHENIKTSSNKLNSVRILIKRTKMSREMFQVSTVVFSSSGYELVLLEKVSWIFPGKFYGGGLLPPILKRWLLPFGY